MRIVIAGLSPDDPRVTDARCQKVIDFWNALGTGGESGATTWEVLDRFQNEVTDCLYRNPPDIDRAYSLTAEAALLIAGMGEL